MTRLPPQSALPGVAEGGATRRLRLLLMTDTTVAGAGGSERFLRNLMALLPRDRYDVTLVELAPDAHATAPGDPHADVRPVAEGLFAVDHVARHRLPVAAVHGRGGWRAMAALRRMAGAQPFDIVQSQHEKSDLLNALLPRRAAAIRISNRRDMGFNKSPRVRTLLRWLNHRFDAVLAPAQPILDGLVNDERVDPRRTQCIPNGVDTERFAPMPPAARRAARQALGLDDDAIVFACVASLTPVKRHVDLLDAFRVVRDRLPQARLLLIGDGPLRAEVQARCAELGLQAAVTLLGNRADVESVLPGADVGVLASSTEGMSNAILELMACGLPVIATDVGGNPALVADGETGRLVTACAPEALAAAMVALAESADVRRAMADAARVGAVQRHSLAAMVRAYDALYVRLHGGTLRHAVEALA